MAMLLAGIEGLLGIHRVPEGHVGVYWRGGALLDRVTDPGFHHMWPLLTWHEAVRHRCRSGSGAAAVRQRCGSGAAAAAVRQRWRTASCQVSSGHI